MINNKILYICNSNPNQISIMDKIDGFKLAANKMGYNVELINLFGSKSLLKYFKQMIKIVTSDAKTVYYRCVPIITIVFYGVFMIAKLQRKKLIVEVATPMRAIIREIMEQRKNKFNNIKYLLYIYISGPWQHWVFDIVIQYGNEGSYFNICNKKRIILIGNGININRINIRKVYNNSHNHELLLVAVSTAISKYHGFDRVIKAIYVWNSESRQYSVKFHVIGDGNALNELKELVTKYNLTQYVIFHGMRNMDYIKEFYSSCHLAVSSLGFFRLKLYEASPLKSREYCAAGIPFIAVGEDPDFPKNVPFRIVVSNDDNISDIVKIFSSFSEIRSKFNDEDIRRYAESNLSFESKLIKIGIKSLI